MLLDESSVTLKRSSEDST
uniref:Uncharacterized protein n=1 Tax=Anguilla anguilla TaxID=7936 RepID=A0A0E9Y014_ANGAN